MPGAGDRSALQHFVGEQRAVPLDPAHPMWRMHLLQGHRGGSALVTRFHHSVAEGIRSTQVLLGLLDPLEGEPPSLAARVGRSGPVHVGTDAAWPVTALLNTAFSVVKIGLWENPRTALDGRPGTEKAVTWTQPLPLAVIKGIGTRTGTTVNDVCTALVAGAMARYLACSAGAGRLVPGDDDVAWLVPVNLDPPGQQPPVELGNRFALVLALLPHGPAAFPDRAAEVHRRVQRIRTSWEPARTFGLSRVCSPSPRHLSVRRRSGSWPPRRWAC